LAVARALKASPDATLGLMLVGGAIGYSTSPEE
jgi:hypothetical protein